MQTATKPTPNKRMHPLDVHALPQRLRGEEEDEDGRPEVLIVWAFAAVLIWTFAAILFLVLA